MRIIITLLFLVTCSTTFAQGFNKKVCVELTYYVRALNCITDFTQDQTAKNALVNISGKLTAEQFTRAMTLANESYFPEGINTPKKLVQRHKEVKKYKAYWQGSWLQTNSKEGWAQMLHLLWLPVEENQHMPDDLKPLHKDGMFFIVSNDGLSLDSLQKPVVPSAKFIESMKSKHNKKELVSIDSAFQKGLYDYGQLLRYPYNDLVLKGEYNDEEFKRITELATKVNWPKAFNKMKEFNKGKDYDAVKKAFGDMYKYKAYKIINFTDELIDGILYWIPKEGNEHMPPDMQPLTDEGFLFVCKIDNNYDPYLYYLYRANTPSGREGYVGDPDPNSSRIAKAKKSSTSNTSNSQPNNSSSVSKTNSYTTSSGIQVSEGVDMSEFTNNSRLGTIMLFYGYDGKASSIYMYELRGKSLSDKQAVVSKLRDKISISTPFIGFEWLPGYDCNSAKGYVYKKTRSTSGTNCQGEFKIN